MTPVRGDLAIAALPGDWGKPRPVVIVQSNRLGFDIGSVVVCPLTTTLAPILILRPLVLPSELNGLRLPSQVMVDKVTALRTERLRETFGRLEDLTMADVSFALSTLLDLDPDPQP